MMIVKAIPKAKATGELANGETQKTTKRKNRIFRKRSLSKVVCIILSDFDRTNFGYLSFKISSYLVVEDNN